MRGLVFAISLCVCTVTGALAEAAGQTSPLVITNVTVIDGTGAAPQPHMSVRIENGHVVELARTASKTVSSSSSVVSTRI